MWKIYFFIITLWCSVGVRCSQQDLQDVLKSIFNERYDKNIRPGFGERPVEVSVSAHVLSISKIDSTNQEFTVDFYFRQSWIDQRLSFMPRPKVQNITLEGALLQKLWVPDTFFLNEVTSSFHSTTVTNELARLKSNGDVTKSMRLTVTATCPMKLKQFPFDSPVCALHIESFSSQIQEIKYEWARAKPSVTFSVESTGYAGDFQFSMFHLRHTSVAAVAPIVGSHSRLTLEIQLKRVLGRYESEFYSPCLLLVLLAVSSFWFGSPKLSAATATLCLFALLVVDNSQITQLKLPKWAEKTWLDCYTRLCITFISFIIIANLLELNTPDESQTDENVQEELQLKEDVESPRENRLASVSREDAKLASTSESREFNPREQLLVIKTKLIFFQKKFYSYARLAQPYVKWGILGLFLISDFIYWKSTPSFKPLDESHAL